MTLVDLEELVEHGHPDFGHGPVRTGLRWDVSPALARCRAARPKGESSATASPPVAVPEEGGMSPPVQSQPAPARTWTVSSRDGLREMLCSRKADLDISGELIDSLAGLPDRLFSKIACGTKRAGPVSLPSLITALALRVAAVDLHDPVAFVELARSGTNLWMVLWACLDQRILTLTFQECPARAARMRKRWVRRKSNGPRRPRLVADQRPAA